MLDPRASYKLDSKVIYNKSELNTVRYMSEEARDKGIHMTVGLGEMLTFYMTVGLDEAWGRPCIPFVTSNKIALL